MAKNSAEGNRTRTARYRAALAARGIRPVQVMAPEGAHALLRQAAGLMTREQDPVELRQALRQVGGVNDAEQAVEGAPSGREQALSAELETVRAAEASARAAFTAAEQHGRALAIELDAARAGVEAAREAERQARTAALARVAAAESAAAQARAEAERFQKTPGLRGRVIRWLAR